MCQGNDLANPPRHLLPDERLVLGGHGASGQWWTRQGCASWRCRRCKNLEGLSVESDPRIQEFRIQLKLKSREDPRASICCEGCKSCWRGASDFLGAV